MNETWDKVMALKDAGRSEAKGSANQLSIEDLETIIGTIDFFGGNYQRDIFDLRVARYRVFDWLAMRVQGRRTAPDQPKYEGDKEATKVLVHSFLKSEGVPSKFIDDLRSTDYDIDHSYKSIKLPEEDE